MIKIIIAGDFVTTHTIDTKIEEGDYSCLDAFRPFTEKADYSIVNLECPVVLRLPKPIQKSGPHLHCSNKAVDCLVKNGFNCVTLANNHFYDQGQSGVEDTIISLQKKCVDYVGGGVNSEEARRILFKEIGPYKVAIINACEHEFSIANSEHGGSNPIDLINIQKDIEKAHREADYVILILHGGIEHYPYPTPRMTRWYRHFVDLGADAVINHHQHCMCGYEVYNGKPIFYGLGNFYFPWSANRRRSKSWEFGYAVQLCLSERIDFEMIPYQQNDEGVLLRDKTVFEEEIESLNEVIKDDTLVQERFDKLIENTKNQLYCQFLPSFMRGRVPSAFARRGLLGELYKKNHSLSLKNKLNCESHLEMFQRLFTIRSL